MYRYDFALSQAPESGLDYLHINYNYEIDNFKTLLTPLYSKKDENRAKNWI